MFDFVLVSGREWLLVWGRKWTSTTMLIIANRISLLSYVVYFALPASTQVRRLPPMTYHTLTTTQVYVASFDSVIDF